MVIGFGPCINMFNMFKLRCPVDKGVTGWNDDVHNYGPLCKYKLNLNSRYRITLYE